MRCFVVLSLVLVACGASAPSDGPPSPTAATGSSSTADPSNRVSVRVISVTDGDTIRVMLNGKSTPIRYIGIDTPETVDPRTEVQCFGREASAYNARLVADKTVELEKDVSETDTVRLVSRVASGLELPSRYAANAAAAFTLVHASSRASAS